MKEKKPLALNRRRFLEGGLGIAAGSMVGCGGASGPSPYMAPAQAAYETIMGMVPTQEVYWRLGHVLDTLVDYWGVADVTPTTARDIELMISKHDSSLPWYPQHQGERYEVPIWYDDYCWWGIACHRASQSTHPALAPYRAKFKQMCDAHWQPVQRNAPHIWRDADKAFFANYAPRLEGGVWNWVYQKDKITDVPYTPSFPNPADDPAGTPQDNLHPMQNTVTNSLYAVMMARLFNDRGDAVFGVEAENEHRFLQQWFNLGGVPETSRLLHQFDAQTALVRERVSSYASGRTALGYKADYFWAGDQGLILGGLVARLANSQIGLSEKLALEQQAISILNGVMQELVLKDDRGLRSIVPWSFYDLSKPDRGAVNGDFPDYSTGNGVLLRYVLDAYRHNSTLRVYLQRAGFGDLARSNAANAVSVINQTDKYHTVVEPDVPQDQRILFFTNDLASLLLAREMSL